MQQGEKKHSVEESGGNKEKDPDSMEPLHTMILHGLNTITTCIPHYCHSLHDDKYPIETGFKTNIARGIVFTVQANPGM